MIDPVWIALSLIPHFGYKTLQALQAHFGSYTALLGASSHDLQAVHGVGKTLAAAIQAIDLPQTERDIVRWQEMGVRILPYDSPDYPSPLHTLTDPPLTLFVRGHWSVDWFQQAVAIVGTRTPSIEGRRGAYQLATRHARDGHTVVSGLALGVDTSAHVAAIKANGPTIAVLGSGVLQPYPPANRSFAQLVLASGALISECAPDASVNAQRLVARNRLISGLAHTVYLVESERDGGAMHAVRFARQQGRAIITLHLEASGNLQLISEGVPVVLVSEDKSE